MSSEKRPQGDALYKQLHARQQQLSEILLDYIVTAPELAEGRSLLRSQHVRVLTRIVGGTTALKGEFNECCLVGKRNLNGTIEWFCTGVLVHPKLVLTAAHCIQNGGAYVVALGTNNQNDLSSAEIINSRKAQIHPAYTTAARINDIAAIVLQDASAHAPVGIAATPGIITASEVELVGFGNDDVLSTRGFGVKRKVSVDMISIRHNTAEDLNREESIFGFESDLEFVAGGKGFDTCNGDSGGPVYINSPAGRLVAGLTSRPTAHPINPCGEGGIYTRVDVHTDFINSFTSFF